MRPGALVERFMVPTADGCWTERKRNLRSRTVADAEKLIRAMGDGWLLERGPWRLLDSDGVVVAASGWERLMHAGGLRAW